MRTSIPDANTNAPFALRRATDADTDAIVELSLAAWAPVFASFRSVFGDQLYARIHPDWRADQAASVRDALARNETWVAARPHRPDRGDDAGECVVGFVNVIFDVANRSGEIYMVAVDPVAQGQGIGSAMTEHALDEMRARNLTLAIVATGGDEGHGPARRTYEKAGFIGCPQVWYAKQLD